MAAEGAGAPAKAVGAARWPIVGFALAASVILTDQITKAAMLAWFGPPALAEACMRRAQPACPSFEISPVVDFSMVWNRGVSFGMLEADSGFGRWGLVVFSFVVAVLLGYWLLKTRRPLGALALGCVIGGAVGNLIDRARFGAVVDFFDFSGPWFGWRIGGWPLGFPWVFNVADAAITVGALLLLAEVLFDTDREGG